MNDQSSIIHSRSPVGCRCAVELIIIIYGFISISPFAQIVIDLRSKISSKCSHTHTQERRTHSHNRNTIRRRFTLASHRQKTIAVLMNPVAYLEGNLSIWHTHTHHTVMWCLLANGLWRRQRQIALLSLDRGPPDQIVKAFTRARYRSHSKHAIALALTLTLK